MKTKGYKGFEGTFDFIEEENYYFGKIDEIPDLITYFHDNCDGIQKRFEEAVDDYLELVKEAGR